MTFENYPAGESGDYYVEFSQWEGEKEERWRLFKRQFLPSNINVPEGMPREMHPWKLADGELNNRPNVVCLETKPFLKFLVDCLNKYPMLQEAVKGYLQHPSSDGKQPEREQKRKQLLEIIGV